MICSLGERGQIVLELAPEPHGRIGFEAKSQAFTEFVEARTQRRFEVCRLKNLQAHRPHFQLSGRFGLVALLQNSG